MSSFAALGAAVALGQPDQGVVKFRLVVGWQLRVDVVQLVRVALAVVVLAFAGDVFDVVALRGPDRRVRRGISVLGLLPVGVVLRGVGP